MPPGPSRKHVVAKPVLLKSSSSSTPLSFKWSLRVTKGLYNRYIVARNVNKTGFMGLS
ncbi:hypothetical protein Hanom_Chr15g01352261 [Helianthus anomalus]